jgi:oligogalacturonide transport system permease protein
MNKILNNKKVIPYIFVAPWIIGFLVFTIIPIFQSFIYSFNQITVSATGIVKTYVGFQNYSKVIFSDPTLVAAYINFAYTLIIYVSLVIVFSLIISLFLNAKVPGKPIFRMIFFLPVIIISGPVLNMMLDNDIMTLSTFNQIANLETNGSAVVGLIQTILEEFTFILWLTGVPVLIFLSGLQKLNGPVFEAAKIDGATGWESFWKITFPALKPMILINIVYTTMLVATLSINPIIKAIEENMLKVETGIGYASSIAWIYFIIILIELLIMLGVANGGFTNKDKIKKNRRKKTS